MRCESMTSYRFHIGLCERTIGAFIGLRIGTGLAIQGGSSIEDDSFDLVIVFSQS